MKLTNLLRRLKSSISMLLLISTLSACQTARQAEEVIQYSYQKTQEVKAIEANIREKLAVVQAQVDTLEANNLTYQKKIERLTGVWDADGDGETDPGELVEVVKGVVKGAVKDPEKRSLLFDWEFWSAIAAAAALWAARHLGVRKGRKDAQPSETTSADQPDETA